MHIFVYMLFILNINKKGSYEFSKSCYTKPLCPNKKENLYYKYTKYYKCIL